MLDVQHVLRIAKDAGQTRERRRQATHPAKVKPELMAERPSQIWSWDITKLRGPSKGVFYHLYVLIDIFSRYNPGWFAGVVAIDAVDISCYDDGGSVRGPRSVHLQCWIGGTWKAVQRTSQIPRGPQVAPPSG